jgi:uncharacterized protein (DUF302 family)
MPTDPAIGLVTVPSAHGAAATLDRLEALLKQKGVTVFARVDHAAGAAAVGLPLRPTAVLLFGNPQVGTPLMQSNQTAGIDLPLKALAWEDADGRSWLTYNDPAYVARRHSVVNRDDILRAMAAALEALAKAATAP